MAQKLHSMTTPSSDRFDEQTNEFLDSKELRELWDDCYGKLCGENKVRLKELRDLNSNDAFQSRVMKSVRKYETRHVAVIQKLRAVFNDVCVFENTNVFIRVWATSGELRGVFSQDASPDVHMVSSFTMDFAKGILRSIMRHEVRVRVTSSEGIILELKEQIGGVRFLFFNDLDGVIVEKNPDVKGEILVGLPDLKAAFMFEFKDESEASRLAELLDVGKSEIETQFKRSKGDCNDDDDDDESDGTKFRASPSLTQQLRAFSSQAHLRSKTLRPVVIPDEDADFTNQA